MYILHERLVMPFLYKKIQSNICFFRDQNLSIASHMHNLAELIYVISATCSLTINDVEYDLECGDLTLIFPNQIHAIHSKDSCQLLVMHISPDSITEYKDILLNSTLISPVIKSSLIRPLSRTTLDTLIEYKASIDNDKNNPNSLFEFDAESENIYFNQSGEHNTYLNNEYLVNTFKGIIIILLADILTDNTKPKDNSLRNSSLCQNALDYIEAHFTEKLSLENTAAHMGINKYYLSRLFSNELNITFTEYLCMRRLNFANALIRHSSESISSIMYKCGFQSERSFYRSFKKYYGKTPLQIRTECESQL